MELKGKKSLRNIFIRYFIYFSLLTAGLIFLYVISYGVMLNKGVLRPANYLEKEIESNRNTILESDTVTKDMIPESCGYGVYTEAGKLISGDFTSKEADTYWTAMQANQNVAWGTKYYKVFYRSNEICIVSYTLIAQFSNPILSKYFGNAEIWTGILFIFIFIGEILLLSARFGKYFSKEIKNLMLVSEKIRAYDLNFETAHSDIREIEEVIGSLNQMKIALRDSLEKQWNMEKSRKDQISALAHDIKTPLTIIKGNAELINEVCKDESQLKYNNYIVNSSSEIEHYLKVLMDMTKSEELLALKPVKIQTKIFFNKIVEQEEALASEKNLELMNELECVPAFFYADEELLYRAIMNVIANAVEYSEKNSKLLFKVSECEDELQFLISDSGSGFSKEALKSATGKFYRDDKSRNSKNHYGIGLSITKSFIESHHGTIELSNSIELGGAQVVLKFPLSENI